MKLTLDLHPIHSDSHKIDQALRNIIDEACDKRAAEIEIIPGKGSGALKKSVLRFLDQPEVKQRYHRVEKDSENWGRLFVHFRWEKQSQPKKDSSAANNLASLISVACFCCQAILELSPNADALSQQALNVLTACPSCGSPNQVTLWLDRKELIHSKVESGY